MYSSSYSYGSSEVRIKQPEGAIGVTGVFAEARSFASASKQISGMSSPARLAKDAGELGQCHLLLKNSQTRP